MDEIDILQAEIMRTLANPRRLQIIHRLVGGPVEVGRIALDVGISQPNASQHLAVMRAVGVVEAERNGREVRYRLSDPEIVAACGLMRGVLARRLERLGGLSGVARLPAGTRSPEAGSPVDPDAPSAPDRPLALATAPTR
ncbi:MAG TPA: metalloregulator ArsR/SmtB family transcription factor [Candidatus Limnocylindrales bacterium]|nr:metalloregulator ArsR/SmtB family transcription factor [Candidatus Limnocylindrales bacterium]